MTLGDVIKEYLENHSISEFMRDSGISKAYIYNLINNKSTNGTPPTPTIEMINKVARGVHSDFDTVFNKLDKDIVLSTRTSRPHAARKEDGELSRMTSHYNIREGLDGSLHINPKPTLSKYMHLIKDDEIQRLLDAADGCTPKEIDLAVNMLDQFKNSR